MLIDLYERPYSSEAPKSRAFIDKIFSLSGPDGGVVGGEDGVSTQRPLKDGGREAWDMIRRLRQKAWQRAGLDPHKLWTEKAQMEAGLAPVDGYGITDPCRTSNSSGRQQPADGDGQLSDFSKTFYSITRSQKVPPVQNHVSAAKPSSLRYQVDPLKTSAPGSPMHSSPLLQSQSPGRLETLPDAGLPSPGGVQVNPTTPSGLPCMDPASPNAQAMGVPTPPSMVDPNLNFDWDQWDAVFGQHLPVADEIMELDPVTGFEFGDLGNARVGRSGFGEMPGWGY